MIRLKSLLSLAVLFLPLCLQGADDAWVPAWVSAQQLTEPRNMPPGPGLAGNTLRQVIQSKLAGNRLRAVFSNEFGDKPLVIKGAHVAPSTGAGAIDPARDVKLTFNGSDGVTVLPGLVAYSDPVTIEVVPFENLAVTTWIGDVSDKLTGHPGSRTTSYIKQDDGLGDASMDGASTTEHWYLLSSVDLSTSPDAAALVVLGDSITDGRGSTTNGNDRWPDDLARRLAANPGTEQISVLNQGVGGGRVLRDGLGVAALARFDRDIIAQPRAKWLITFIGVNDIGTGNGARKAGQPYATAQDLIDAFHQMIVRAHAHGIKVIGATITPFGGSFYDSPEAEDIRLAVNKWIRESGEFDGVIDFDKVARDPANPHALSPKVDGGDHLHPSAEGYHIMADAIDLGLFE